MKTIIPWMLATAVIMLVFPWLAVTFIKGDGGMAACFILFFAVNPIYAICSGAYAGKNIKKFGYYQLSQRYSFCLGHGCSLVWEKKNLFYMRWDICS